jgi:periplasmic divalent cation tolerance protein
MATSRKKKPARARAAREVIVVVTTVGTEEQALDIAHHLVRSRLAACVNILPGVRSVFRWKGKVNDDGEFLLLAKTVRPKFEAVREAMKELNAYELPEILGFPASLADVAFAKWVVDSTRGKPDAEDEEDGEEAAG